MNTTTSPKYSGIVTGIRLGQGQDCSMSGEVQALETVQPIVRLSSGRTPTKFGSNQRHHWMHQHLGEGYKPLLARLVLPGEVPRTFQTGHWERSPQKACAHFEAMRAFLGATSSKYGVDDCFECRNYFLQEFSLERRWNVPLQVRLKMGVTIVSLEFHAPHETALEIVATPPHCFSSAVELARLQMECNKIFLPTALEKEACYETMSLRIKLGMR